MTSGGPPTLYTVAAQEAAAQGDRTRALEPGPEGLGPGPE